MQNLCMKKDVWSFKTSWTKEKYLQAGAVYILKITFSTWQWCYLHCPDKSIMYLALLLLCLLSSIMANNDFYTFNSVVSTRNATSKPWFLYIEELVNQLFLRSLAHDRPKENSLLCVLSHQPMLTSSFKKFSIQVLFPILSVKSTHVFIFVKTSIKVTRVTGKIVHQDMNGYDMDRHTGLLLHKKDSIFVCLILLNRNLAINLTFHTLTFSQIQCNAAIVKISNTESRKCSFKFCGQHSKFMVFPQFPSIRITVAMVTSVFVYCSVIVLFQVMTADLVKTIKHQSVDTAFIGLKHWSVVKIHNESVMSVCFIVTPKIEFLVLERPFFPLQMFVIHDGPGYLSPIITFNKNKLKTSSFQCSMLWRQGASSITEDILCFFSQMLQTTTNIYAHNTANLSFSSNQLSVNPVIIIVIPYQSFLVNVTVTSMRFVGQESFICKYGGFVAVEIIGSKHTEHDTICTNFVSFAGKSFYSSKSSLTIMLYWYQYYSAIFAAIKLSETQCKPVRIQTCSYDSLCVLCVQHLNCNLTKCAKYLEETTARSSISLNVEQEQGGTWRNAVFSLPDNSCFVLQPIKSARNFTMSQVTGPCVLGITPDETLLPHRQIHFTMHGFFSPAVLSPFVRKLFEEDPHFDSDTTPLDMLSFTGIVDTFCFYDNETAVQCQHNRKFGLEKYFSIESSFLEWIFVYAFITSKTPIYKNRLQIDFSMDPQTNSWIEVIVSRVIVTTNLHNLFSEVVDLGDTYDVQNIPVSTNTIAFLEISPSSLNGSLVLSIFTETNLFLCGVLRWINNMTIVGHVPAQKYISLTHQLKIMTLGITNEEYFNVSVSLMWIHDIFSKYSLMLQTNSQSPYLSNRLKFVASSFNRSFSGSKKFYLLFKNGTVQSLKNQHLKSWSKASDLCREAGGNLPYFISRTDLEELIALLKLSTDLLPIESLYIGLKFNQSKEVNFSTKMWLIWLKKDSCVVVLLFVLSYLIFWIGFIQNTRLHCNEQIFSKTQQNCKLQQRSFFNDVCPFPV